MCVFVVVATAPFCTVTVNILDRKNVETAQKKARSSQHYYGPTYLQLQYNERNWFMYFRIKKKCDNVETPHLGCRYVQK